MYKGMNCNSTLWDNYQACYRSQLTTWSEVVKSVNTPEPRVFAYIRKLVTFLFAEAWLMFKLCQCAMALLAKHVWSSHQHSMVMGYGGGLSPFYVVARGWSGGLAALFPFVGL